MLWHVTMPQLVPTLAFYAIVELINMLSWVFAYVYVMTLGGPKNSTVVTEYYIYQQVFQNNVIGVGAAAGVVLLGVVARADRRADVGAKAFARADTRPEIATVDPRGRAARARSARPPSRHLVMLIFTALAAVPDLFHARERVQDQRRVRHATRSAPRTTRDDRDHAPGARRRRRSIAGSSNSFLITAARSASRRRSRRLRRTRSA